MTADSNSQSHWARYGPVLRFLAKAVAVYGVWYVLYDLWLLPDGRLDAWVSQAAASVTGTTLSGLGLDVAVEGRTVQLAQTSGVRIVNGCNGLATIGAFIGFIVAYPGKTKRRLWFIPLGIAVIFLANVVRVSVLAGVLAGGVFLAARNAHRCPVSSYRLWPLGLVGLVRGLVTTRQCPGCRAQHRLLTGFGRRVVHGLRRISFSSPTARSGHCHTDGSRRCVRGWVSRCLASRPRLGRHGRDGACIVTD
ncbi:exosortase/archaeosortase family protein [Salinibacter ruber]|uniref:exosortase/archaeosortase family protein n=1 Tax=Salinibacter ruber TaxID=146919 RepID=UPI002167578D|nr:exosortase/archaeosortase family protein [Salinibacter ruber]